MENLEKGLVAVTRYTVQSGIKSTATGSLHPCHSLRRSKLDKYHLDDGTVNVKPSLPFVESPLGFGTRTTGMLEVTLIHVPRARNYGFVSGLQSTPLLRLTVYACWFGNAILLACFKENLSHLAIDSALPFPPCATLWKLYRRCNLLCNRVVSCFSGNRALIDLNFLSRLGMEILRSLSRFDP